jgi:hypothetical protein
LLASIIPFNSPKAFVPIAQHLERPHRSASCWFQSLTILIMAKASKPTQSELILQHLQEHGSITPLQALDLYGCFRLAARINELIKEGHQFHVKMFITPGGARVARYHLQKKDLFS